MTISRNDAEPASIVPPKQKAGKTMDVDLKVVRLVASATLDLAGIFVILLAFATPLAMTTSNGLLLQIIAGAVMIWLAQTVALAKSQSPSDFEVLQDDHPLIEDETSRREAVNMTCASDLIPTGTEATRREDTPSRRTAQQPGAR